MATDNEDDSPTEVEVPVLPRETWEHVKRSLEKFEAHLENAKLLSSAARQYHDELLEGGRSLEEVDRQAILKALEGTLLLVDDLFPGQSVLKRPLIRVYDAIVGVHNGLATDPVLQVERPQQRPSHGASVQRLKGEAAAALSLYYKAGQKLNPASEIVARKVKMRDVASIGYRMSPNQDITGRTIREWRSEVTKPKAQSIAVERYNMVLYYFKACGADEAAGEAEFVLAELLTPPKKTG